MTFEEAINTFSMVPRHKQPPLRNSGMHSKGLQKMRLEFKFLQWFLSLSPSRPQASVWSLKQFVAIDDPAEFPPNETLKVDYGFMNCQTFEETCIPLEIYKRLLREADPVELHEDCLAGRLFEFAEAYHHMDEGHRMLMRNPYPLRRK
ncbi:hypothetical protein BTUL_0089g00470 [Botrytis tulipae]|uniref:Uncharacterized protein n=1 Tax=Botrytis tulipae TaxID=87230 RepID=A0A4Z1ELK4_9HELO|nr:hypothetical protein BTUL_0089g00470 [Botrytis tulipae]